MKRILCVMLVLITVVSSVMIAGCAKNGDVTDVTTEAPGTVSGEEDTSEPDGLPEVKFNGQEFRIITTDVSERDIFAEDHMTTDPLHDAVFTRNLNVEERFGIKIKVTVDGYSAVTDRIKRSVKAGSDEYDLCFVHMVNGAVLAQDNDILPFEKLPYVDFSKPWWDSDIKNGFSIRNNLMMANGDISPTSFNYTACLYFNKKMFDNLDLEYPYELVKEGKWTLDKLIEYTKEVSQDKDSDGKISRDSSEDVFGLTCYFLNTPYSFYYGAGGMLVSKDENDVPFFDPQNERDTAIYDKIYKALITSRANFETDESYELNVIKIFQEGRAMFWDHNLSAAEFLRDMNDDYGFIPEPKLDDSQDDYRSFVNGASSMICVPATVKPDNREYVSIITEALASEAYKIITPALIEQYIKRKMTRDADSAEMVDYIVRKRVFDMAYVNLWDGAGSYVRDLLRNKSATGVSSKLKNLTSQSKRKIERIVKAFDASLRS